MASLTIIIFSCILLLVTTIYLYIKIKFNYWKNKNVPYVKPTSIFGNYEEWILQKKYIGLVLEDMYKKFPKEPMIGAFLGLKPVLIVKDPESIKLIMNKEFTHFAGRDQIDYIHKETFGQSLFKDYGVSWKLKRSNLAPMFTSAKLKKMFTLIEKCAVDFEMYLDNDIVGKTVEVRHLVSVFTMASFVSCTFGIDLKNFGEANVFRKMGQHFFSMSTKKMFFNSLRMLWPNLFYTIGMRQIPLATTIFFSKLLKELFDSRNYTPSDRNDFVDLFLNLKKAEEKQFRIIDDEYIAAQCMTIFVGGYETSATALSYLLYELAKHKECQDKVHKEIDVYLKKTNGKITYDCSAELPFTSACFEETLRFYSVVSTITREVTKDYEFPLGVTLERGQIIHFPIYALHHDSKFFPNPEEFKPERFYGETKQKIVPYSYMPFGGGPRNCIGLRFARLQSFSGIVTVLRNHKVELAEGTPTKLDFEPKTFAYITHAKGGINLKFSNRT